MFGIDIYIAVMGMTGAGKSTFINTVAGGNTKVGHSLQACTQEIEECTFSLGQYRIHLIDTPGFDDTDRSDADILEHIASWLHIAYKNAVKLTGIIYLHRLTDNRITGSAVKNLRMFKKLCGVKNLANVLLVTTMWENIKDQSHGERREQELLGTGKFWGSMVVMKARVCRHNGTNESAIAIISELLENKPITLQIQDELHQGKVLADTEAGKEVVDELVAKAKEREKELQELKQQMLDNMHDKSKEAQQMLSNQRAEYEALLAQKEADLQARLNLSESNSESLRRRILELEHANARRNSGFCIIS